MLGWIDRSHRRRSFFVQPFVEDFPGTILLREPDIRKFKCRLHTIVRFTLRRQKANTYLAELVDTYESFDDPALEVEAISEKHGLPTEFSEAVQSDALRSEAFRPGQRKDLTHCIFVTIDGESAKDFDDAVSVSKTSGGYHLLVAIADVSHFVRPNTALDQEAYQRGTSVYFPGICIPMLPEKLSNDLCSLVPHKNRYVLVADMHLNNAGEITRSSVYPATIQSRARLTYTLVGAFLDNKQRGLMPEAVETMLDQSAELFDILLSRRNRGGALDLDLPESEIEVNEKGDVLRIGPSVRNTSHRLIEQFMVKANEAVSDLIEKKGYPSIYRVHEDPDPLKMEDLRKMLANWGFRMNLKGPLAPELQKFLCEVKGHPAEKALVVSLLRSLKKAIYSEKNIGHFGLGSESYCHFTSPIRRYPDLLIHRILRDSQFLQNKTGPLSADSLHLMAEHCSLVERRAFLASRDLEDIKKCRFMEPQVGNSFDGFISSIQPFGVFVEIEPYGLEGLIPLRYLPGDGLYYDESRSQLLSRRSKLSFSLGDRLRVRLSDVHRLRRQITFMYQKHCPIK